MRDGGPHLLTPAGSYPGCVSPYGILDMVGSLWEWCSDWFEEKYYSEAPAENPKGPPTGIKQAARGGGWMSSSFITRAAYRQGVELGWSDQMRGIRCVQDEPKGAAK